LLVEIAIGHVDRLRALIAEEQARPEPSAEARVRALIVRFMAVYADSQAEHRVLTEDVKFLAPADRRRIVDGEREVVDAFAAAIVAARPALAATHLQKPLTMLLFGMMNWMFTWLRPDGALTHAEMTPVVADLFFGGLAAVAVPSAENPLAPTPSSKSRSAPSRALAAAPGRPKAIEAPSNKSAATVSGASAARDTRKLAVPRLRTSREPA
jgi:hypothetical protein